MLSAGNVALPDHVPGTPESEHDLLSDRVKSDGLQQRLLSIRADGLHVERQPQQLLLPERNKSNGHKPCVLPDRTDGLLVQRPYEFGLLSEWDESDWHE
jgi:hypothetical protein